MGMGNGENGVARHGYAADAPFIDSPRDARYHYSKRFGIESSYRLFEQAIATTTTRINGTAAVRGGESPLTERLAVPSLRVCGDAPPRRASPLVMVPYKGVRQYDSTSCVDGPRGASGPSPQIGHLTTTDSTANHRPSKPAGEWRRCRVGG